MPAAAASKDASAANCWTAKPNVGYLWIAEARSDTLKPLSIASASSLMVSPAALDTPVAPTSLPPARDTSLRKPSLLRALLPALAPDSRWVSLVALATDFADGRLARSGDEPAFGACADPIADGVFWSGFALRWERNPWLRWAPLALFAAPTGVIVTTYFVRGRVIDYPRPVAIRYLSAGIQIRLTLRAWRSIAL